MKWKVTIVWLFRGEPHHTKTIMVAAESHKAAKRKIKSRIDRAKAGCRHQDIDDDIINYQRYLYKISKVKGVKGI